MQSVVDSPRRRSDASLTLSYSIVKLLLQTKGDLVRYYQGVAPFMLPHLRDRPLTLKLYPDGINTAPIFVQALPRGTPSWIKRWPHHLSSGNDTDDVNWRIIATDEATLVWLANRAAIELHTWLSRITAAEQPDMLLFDLDPGPNVSFATVCGAALDVRTLLTQAMLDVWPKTSGGKGLHLAVPLAPGHTFDGVRAWASHRNSPATALATAIHAACRKNRAGGAHLDRLRSK